MKNLVDHKSLMRFISEDLEGNEALFAKLFSIMDQYLSDLQKVGPADSPEKMETLGKLAHKVKSSCKSFGANHLVEALQNIEDAARAKDLAKVETNYKKVFAIKDESFTEILKVSKEKK